MCTVLMVDDEADAREILCIELASFGHDVTVAANGGEALAWLNAKRPNRPCLVILDLRMPVMDGWDFVERLREDRDWARVPVIVVSAGLKRGSDAPVMSAQAFWQKPPDPRHIQNIRCYCDVHRDSAIQMHDETTLVG